MSDQPPDPGTQQPPNNPNWGAAPRQPDGQGWGGPPPQQPAQPWGAPQPQQPAGPWGAPQPQQPAGENWGAPAQQPGFGAAPQPNQPWNTPPGGGPGAPGWPGGPGWQGGPGWPGAPGDPNSGKQSNSSGMLIGIIAGVVVLLLVIGGIIFAVTRSGDKKGGSTRTPVAGGSASSGQNAPGGSATGTSVSPFDLVVGDCVQLPADVSLLVKVRKLDCASPHNGQVFIDYQLTGSTYPGDSEIRSQTLSSCQDKAANYLGNKSTELHVVSLFPTQTRWDDDGDRKVHCLLVDRAKEFTGDVRDDA